MPINLEGIRRFVERDAMTDQILVTRDAGGKTNNIYDEDKMEYVPDPEHLDTVYQGDAMVIPVTQGEAEQIMEGGQEIGVLRYDLYVPLAAPELEKWDKVEVTLSGRDPDLSNQIFWVEDQVYSTFAVMRQSRILNRRPRYYPGSP
jgi:hypothetical protein